MPERRSGGTSIHSLNSTNTEALRFYAQLALWWCGARTQSGTVASIHKDTLKQQQRTLREAAPLRDFATRHSAWLYSAKCYCKPARKNLSQTGGMQPISPWIFVRTRRVEIRAETQQIYHGPKISNHPLMNTDDGMLALRCQDRGRRGPEYGRTVTACYKSVRSLLQQQRLAG
jgi:hypothetical protein